MASQSHTETFLDPIMNVSSTVHLLCYYVIMVYILCSLYSFIYIYEYIYMGELDFFEAYFSKIG